MISILDKIKRDEAGWYPRTPQEFVAIHLARALNDTDNLGRYIKLSRRYEVAMLVRALKEARRIEGDNARVVERFLDIVRELTGEEQNGT